ncbi:hypothetical protein BX600DRAFT_516275 [Xylariales sp. PMI_506]|nr:hypothetical protein BX600DRAFT_516275 [Xylariales sp. PMI_506]
MAPTLFIGYEKGSEINVEYYKNTHLPLVLDAWKSLATKGWKVYTSPGDRSPYELLLAVEFESSEALSQLQTVVSAETQKALADDTPNYSKKAPVIFGLDNILSG